MRWSRTVTFPPETHNSAPVALALGEGVEDLTAGLVHTRREGTKIFYSLARPPSRLSWCSSCCATVGDRTTTLTIPVARALRPEGSPR